MKFLKSTNKLMPFLIDEERAQLRAQHKQERDRHIADRIKTVMLSDKGWSVQQISEALFLSEDAIRQHLKEYAFSRKLKPEGGGSDEKLSREQSQQLEAHLGQHTYLHAKDIVA